MPNHKQVRSFYDDRYYQDERGESHARLPWHMRRIATRMEPLRGKSVLDVACGTGGWLQELSKRGADVCGTDISAKAAKIASARLPHAEIHSGVAEELAFADNRFDLVTCLGSLEHFLDQPGALREMVRVSKAGAHILILVPNAGFLTRRLGLYRGTGQVAIRETVRSIGEWSDMFREAGLRVEAMWRDLHPLSWKWICSGPAWGWPIRTAQATLLACWPVRWQYQVYFLCSRQSGS